MKYSGMPAGMWMLFKKQLNWLANININHLYATYGCSMGGSNIQIPVMQDWFY